MKQIQSFRLVYLFVWHPNMVSFAYHYTKGELHINVLYRFNLLSNCESTCVQLYLKIPLLNGFYLVIQSISVVRSTFNSFNITHPCKKYWNEREKVLTTFFTKAKREAVHTVVSIPAIYLVSNQQRKIGQLILTTLYVLVSF